MRLLIVFVAVLFVGVAFGEHTDLTPTEQSLLNCMEITDDDVRLECFDLVIAALDLLLEWQWADETEADESEENSYWDLREERIEQTRHLQLPEPYVITGFMPNGVLQKLQLKGKVQRLEDNHDLFSHIVESEHYETGVPEEERREHRHWSFRGDGVSGGMLFDDGRFNIVVQPGTAAQEEGYFYPLDYGLGMDYCEEGDVFITPEEGYYWSQAWSSEEPEPFGVSQLLHGFFYGEVIRQGRDFVNVPKGQYPEEWGTTFEYSFVFSVDGESGLNNVSEGILKSHVLFYFWQDTQINGSCSWDDAVDEDFRLSYDIDAPEGWSFVRVENSPTSGHLISISDPGEVLAVERSEYRKAHVEFYKAYGEFFTDYSDDD